MYIAQHLPIPEAMERRSKETRYDAFDVWPSLVFPQSPALEGAVWAREVRRGATGRGDRLVASSRQGLSGLDI